MWRAWSLLTGCSLLHPRRRERYSLALRAPFDAWLVFTQARSPGGNLHHAARCG